MNHDNYWKLRGNNYLQEQRSNPKYIKDQLRIQEEKIINLLKNSTFNNVVEFGCGYGRFTKILVEQLKPENYVAIDISEGQINNAKNYVNNDKVKFHCLKIQEFNSKEKFDLVFSAEVLMHIPFSNIEQVIKKMISLCSKKIVTIDWYNDQKIGKESRGYCFMHDYSKLFMKMGVKSVKIQKLPTSFSLKLLNAYFQIRGHSKSETQAIIEIDV